jgi:hypothetical protein
MKNSSSRVSLAALEAKSKCSRLDKGESVGMASRVSPAWQLEIERNRSRLSIDNEVAPSD